MTLTVSLTNMTLTVQRFHVHFCNIFVCGIIVIVIITKMYRNTMIFIRYSFDFSHLRLLSNYNLLTCDSENHDLCGALYCTPSVKFCSLSRKQKMIVQQLTRKNLLSQISGCPLGYKLSNSISGLFFLVAQTQWSFFI